jgi:hypothetical protein
MLFFVQKMSFSASLCNCHFLAPIARILKSYCHIGTGLDSLDFRSANGGFRKKPHGRIKYSVHGQHLKKSSKSIKRGISRAHLAFSPEASTENSDFEFLTQLY